jgi:hypothetical protein
MIGLRSVFFGAHRVRGMDELQRCIELVALSVVAVGAWLLAVACSLLQHGGIGVPSLATDLLALPVFHGVTRRWAQRRYR